MEAILAMSGEFSGVAVARFSAAVRIASPPCAMAASKALCCCGKRFGGDPAKVFGGMVVCISATAAFTALMTAGLAGPEEPFGLICVPAPTFTVLPAGVRKVAEPVARPNPLAPAKPDVPRMPAVPTGVVISKLDPDFCLATSK